MTAAEHAAAAGSPSARRRAARALGTLLVVVAALLAVLGLAWAYARVFAPERRATATVPVVDFDVAPMRSAVEPEAVAREQDAILAFGSRYLGQPGMYAADAHVRRAFEAAGLEIHEQPIRALAPRTAHREVYRAAPARPGFPYGEPLEDVQVYPLMPNHLQPIVTPADGVEGELVVLDASTLARRSDFSDVIGLIDTGTGGVATDYGYHWARYAQLGVKAVILAHREGLAAADWNAIAAQRSGLVSSVPVNFVRLAATPSIFEHVGERLRLRVRVDFVEHETRTSLGVLRAKRPAREAIVLYAPHDAAALLPDLAPGALPALNTAYFLQLLRGLVASRGELERDVIFMASGSSVMGEAGLNEIIRVLQYNTFAGRSNRLLDAFDSTAEDAPRADVEAAGTAVVESTRLRPVEEREAENDVKLRDAGEVLRAFDSPGFLRDAATTEARLASLSPRARAFFLTEFQYVIGEVVLERQETALQQKLRIERRGSQALRSPEFQEYLAARRQLDTANAIAGSRPVALLERSPELARALGLAGRVRTRLRELGAWHARRRAELAGDRAVARLFSRYRDFAVLRPLLVPAPTGAAGGPEVLSLYAQSIRQTQSIDHLLQSAARRVGLDEAAFRVEPIATSPTQQTTVVENQASPAPTHSHWQLTANGYMSLGLVNFQRQPAYQRWSSPEVEPFMRDLASLRGSFASGGELLLYLAHGNGLLGGVQGYAWQRKSFGGRVLVSNVGQSVVPSFPLKHAVLGARGVDREELHSRPGYWVHPFFRADPYGRFDLPELAADFGVWWRMYNDGYAFTPLAVGYGADGLIAFMKDEGEEGQRLFKSITVPLTNERLIRDVSVVTFRASPVSLLDLTNPQDFKDYAEVQMIRPEGLTPFSKRCEYNGLGLVTAYLPPDQRAHVLLKSGRPDNENVREIRAFLLNPGAAVARASSAGEIQGAGYLVADTPFLRRVPFEAAASMAAVNGRRLSVQERYGMADERTRRYQQKTLALLAQAKAPELSARDAALRARDAVSYAGLNHPVLRESVLEAVIGILFYLGLLVPFVFFAEKLLFGFADVRRQIAAQAAIFLIVFGLLRLLHPAFQMVRSSLMILLGFVIVLVSGGITVLFSGKARENLAELRKRQGRVAAAEVDTLGVVASSFLVGLNNMQRRKVRTGLTCATLTLLTFVMICFTSTQNDVVEQTLTVGRAEYQGLLSKHDDFLPMTDSEAFALKSKFSERFKVSERRFVTGAQDWKERKKVNPRLTALVEGVDGARRAAFSSILKLGPDEPLRGGLRLLTRAGWFLPEHASEDGKPVPVLLPDRLAERLGLTSEAVDAQEIVVTINDRPFRVWGIFTAESLEALRDLDGSDLLPFDIERVSSLTDTKTGYSVDSDSPRIPADRVIIVPPRDLRIGVINGRDGREVIASVAVDMGKVGFRTAKEDIEAHLEKTALPAFFGLDGVAYRGLRARELTLAGLFDLLVPLLLAGLTVLNTMKGSVYERRSEIYVYNAIGVSPRYVLVMFLAEAFVYVVIGSVLGYLLSQGVGRLLTELGLTGGLNMTFTSLATIYASLAIAVAVFVSTWFPARSAMDIAAPAEESGWRLPEPDGDRLAFDLPFNFRGRDRVAVLAFFQRWLSEHGEGSSGRFFASPPLLGIAEQLDAVTGQAVPEMRLTVWLKPFDLAVSQELVITTPHDPETGQFKARLSLDRASGTREAWMRLNRTFVAAVRRHFLHWRAVTDAEREEMYAEARLSLEARYASVSGAGAEDGRA